MIILNTTPLLLKKKFRNGIKTGGIYIETHETSCEPGVFYLLPLSFYL